MQVSNFNTYKCKANTKTDGLSAKKLESPYKTNRQTLLPSNISSGDDAPVYAASVIPSQDHQRPRQLTQAHGKQ